MKTTSKFLSCLLTGTSLAWIVGAAQAAAQTTDTSSAANSKLQIEEVVVTAERRAETAQNTPAAITAITGEELAAQGIDNPTGLSALVPSAQFDILRSQVQVFVRGVGQSNSGINADPAIATNLNGIYQLSDMTAAAFFDLARVEVLPGPQGTLYGRNAAGGAVNVITRRPGDTYGGNASVELGSYGLANVEAGIDLPVTDTFAIRAAGTFQRHDGYLSDGGDDKDTKAARLTGVYKPNDRLSIVVVGSYTRGDGIGDQVVNNPPYHTSDPWYYPFPTRKLGLYSRDNVYTVSGELNYQFTDHLKLTYLTGYDNFDRSQFLILNGIPSPQLLETQDIQQYGQFYSNEVRLAGNYSRLRWVMGAYLYNSVQDYNNHVWIQPASVDVYQGPIHINANGVAGFGQLTYSIYDWLRLTGGLRYSYDKKDGGGPYTVVVHGTPHPSPFLDTVSGDRLDWKIGLEADVAEHSLVYFNVQTGYNEGGFSFAPAGVASSTYPPEKLTAYTIGSKNRFLDGRLQFNVEGYYYDYSNYQVSARDLLTALNIIYPAQSAEVYGAQIDAAYLLTDNDKLTASLGLLHAVATRLILPPSAGGTNYSGLQLPDAPPVTLTASYEHDWELQNGADLAAKVSENFIAQQWESYNHAPGTYQKGFHKTDISLTYTPASGKWSLQAWARNLENEATFASLVSASIPGPGAGFLDPPRTYGIRLTANF